MCVSDIILGRVPYEAVGVILARTKAAEPPAIEALLEDYARNHWESNPDKGKEIARQLFAEGKIDQIRLRSNFDTAQLDPPRDEEGRPFHWTDEEGKLLETSASNPPRP